MRKLISVLGIGMMMILLCTTMAVGESLFFLPTAAEVEAAPSFGVMKGISPSSKLTLADGGVKETYIDITDNDFLQFGTLLAEKGYAVESQETVDGEVRATVVKDDIRILVSYRQNSKQISVTYPQNVKIESMRVPDPFENYTVVALGETVVLKDVGEICFTEFHLDQEIKVFTQYSGRSSEKYYTDESNTWIEGILKNMSPNNLYYWKGFLNEFIDVTLCYVNNDYAYDYTVPCYMMGNLDDNGICSGYVDTARYSYDDRRSPYIASLHSAAFGMAFNDVPDAVRQATDGILAVTFSTAVHPEDQYVIYLRNPNQ